MTKADGDVPSERPVRPDALEVPTAAAAVASVGGSPVEGGVPAAAVVPEPGLGRTAAVGMAWSTGSRLLIQVLQFAASIVMARILSPRDFGLIATVYIFSGLASLLSEMGLSAALVQKRDLNTKDTATAFWINALVGLGLTVLVGGVIGPLVAAFYGEPVLRPLMWVVATTFLLTVYVVPLGLLERSLSFKRIAVIELVAYAMGSVAAVAAAVAGLGVYSLAVSPVVTGVLLSVMFLGVVRYRPRSFISRKSAVDLWGFSGAYTGANLLAYFSSNVDGLLIGRVLGQVPLGYFGRSSSLVTLPSQQLSYVMARVMLPTLARMRDDLPRLQQAYLNATGLLAIAICTSLGVLAATAEHLVPFVWGERWRPMIVLVEALALAGCLRSLTLPVTWLCQVAGRTGLQFRLGLITFALSLIGSVVGLQYGVVGVARALAVSALFASVPALIVGSRLLLLPVRSLLRPLVPGVTSAVLGVSTGFLIGEVLAGTPVLLLLALQSCSVLLVSGASALLLDHLLGGHMRGAAWTLLRLRSTS